MASRQRIGDALAEGTLEAAQKWGRLEEDKKSGALRFPAWGSVFHYTLPAVEWAYGSLLGAGDVVWHGYSRSLDKPASDAYSIEKMLEVMSAKTVPYTGDPYMFSYSWKGEEARTTGIYSGHKAKQVAWARHYACFWNESMAFCEMMLPGFFNLYNRGFIGPSPDAELRYYKAVTGKNLAFADTMEIGRKIWNLERAIRVIEGRHRDDEKFFPFMYMPGASHAGSTGKPVYENGKWSWEPLLDMYMDEKGVELFKTNYYKLEGWDINSGWPTRKTLEDQGMRKIADTLAAKGRLGA